MKCLHGDDDHVAYSTHLKKHNHWDSGEALFLSWEELPEPAVYGSF